MAYNIRKGGTSVSGAYSSWCQPTTVCTEVNVNMVEVAIREERHSATHKRAELNISRTSVNRILMENLAMRIVLWVWVPHFLTNMQKNDCVTACQEN